ncbi:hypothetical protein [Priestia megaterium]|uniref:hypothetical protein n=1 Tax=Priestia megaterium TaxID=1404 RepID=UPI00300A5C5D
MKDINIHDLMDLILADVPDSDEKIQKMFEWHFDRLKTLSTWILGTSITTVVAVFVSYMRTNSSMSGWYVIATLLLGLCTSCYGIYLLWVLRKLNKQFINSLKLHSKLSKMKKFIVKYQEKAR